jgi:hypothetical protein
MTVIPRVSRAISKNINFTYEAFYFEFWLVRAKTIMQTAIMDFAHFCGMRHHTCIIERERHCPSIRTS